MVNKNTTIGDVIEGYKNGQYILQGFGLHCFGCPMSRMETIEEAAQVHGIEVDFMLKTLNENLQANEKSVRKATAKKTTAAKTTAKTIDAKGKSVKKAAKPAPKNVRA